MFFKELFRQKSSNTSQPGLIILAIIKNVKKRQRSKAMASSNINSPKYKTNTGWLGRHQGVLETPELTEFVMFLKIRQFTLTNS